MLKHWKLWDKNFFLCSKNHSNCRHYRYVIFRQTCWTIWAVAILEVSKVSFTYFEFFSCSIILNVLRLIINIIYWPKQSSPSCEQSESAIVNIVSASMHDICTLMNLLWFFPQLNIEHMIFNKWFSNLKSLLIDVCEMEE